MKQMRVVFHIFAVKKNIRKMAKVDIASYLANISIVFTKLVQVANPIYFKALEWKL